MLSRRDILKLPGFAALSASLPALPPAVAVAQVVPADYRLDISPISLEVSPHHVVKTVGYNGQVPGPLLRFKEGRPVTIDVTNHTARPEVVHWHGLHLPSDVDGAMEEGTPPISPSETVRYTFTPRPAGFRWYHTHTMAMGDFTLAQYGGQHGPLLIEPINDPARYDREIFLVLHDWDGRLSASDDGAMNPSYAVSTINGKTMGFGEPLRVEQGQRVLLHVLNSSPTEVHWVAFAGHRMQVVSLDGNPVPRPQIAPMLRLAPAERVCAVVEMNNPGIWVFGEVRKHVQSAGMAIVVEYANQQGEPRWEQPSELIWSYEQFADPQVGTQSSSAIAIPLVIESKFRGHGAMEAWTINGESYPDTHIAPLRAGQRYRLQFINRSMDDHPLHLHRHSFELCKLGAALNGRTSARPGAMRGVLKDVVLVNAQTQTDVEFIASNPGATLLHCHQQNHMDLGFMMLLNYE
jgi:FtsP/CotA-like multicopper oxidase with cupredoxin domain